MMVRMTLDLSTGSLPRRNAPCVVEYKGVLASIKMGDGGLHK